MKQTTERIIKIDQAIKAWHRCTGAMPIVLVRYRDTLSQVNQWEKKFALAQTKLKMYRRQARYYQKKVGY